MATKSPRMRADGAKNRETILAVAADVFASQGFDVALEAIASQAGVSRMTLYRNFADREALAVAVFERSILELEGLAQRLKDEPNGFAEYLERMTERFVENQGFSELVSRNPPYKSKIDAISGRSLDAMMKLARSAKDTGRLRDDFTRADAVLLTQMFAKAISTGRTRTERLDARRRAAALLNEGLSPRK